MDILFDSQSETEGVIKISLKETDYQNQVAKKIKNYSQKANIKGFRPGKVPPGLIKSLYGKSIIIDEINEIVNKNLREYLQKSEKLFVGEPIFDYEKNATIDWLNQKNFEFEYKVGCAKDFTLPINKDFTITQHSIIIDDSVLNETIANLQNQFKTLESADQVEKEDIITFKTTVNENEKEFTVDLSKATKTTVKKCLKHKVQDTLTLDAHQLYEDKNRLLNEWGMSLAEFEKASLHPDFQIIKIQRPQIHPINQDFYDKAFGKDKIKNHEEFLEKLKEEIGKSYSKEEETFFQYQLKEKLISMSNITLPDAFLKEWLLNTNENLDPDILDKKYDTFSRDLRWSLIVNKISKSENIAVENEEVIEETKRLFSQQFQQANLESSLTESHINQLVDSYLKEENGKNYTNLYNQLHQEKVYNWIKNEIKIETKKISLEAFRKL